MCRMSSSLSAYILALISFYLYVCTSPADAHSLSNHSLSQDLKIPFAKKQSHKFYRELGLSPRLEVNIVEHDPLANASTIVEKHFRFPFHSDYEAANSAGPDVQKLGHYAGYFKLSHTKAARMFYYFFEARQNKEKAPVVVWLTGGPGCSSSIALFYENGPFKLTKNWSLVWNQYGWDQESNIIFIDQPTGTGFSYSTDDDDIRNTSEEAAVDFYDFIQHPEYVKNDFYITGESYAGHYIPAFAARVHNANKNKQGIHINFKMKLINQSQYNYLKKPVKDCLKEVKYACVRGTHYNLTACAQTYIDCDVIYRTIMDLNNGLNPYDIRKNCRGYLCYNLSGMESFLNQTSVKKALGVDEDIEFVSCSDYVFDAMLGDQMMNHAVYIPELLQDGIKLLVYAGEYDFICNWLGNFIWVAEMQWWGHKGFWWARYVPFNVDGVNAGSIKRYGPLTFVKVKDAGHLVPMDQPKVALQMLRRWTKGIPL
ncbi:serine carboxypeptidase-like 48 [Phtheirospermum japonicum]|uniref:Carboxypeptidase n=1 Tax=Phtheirospermum japonicum TaxID=374723 RepID=A0A830C5R9_9LAMI|nr:serine carboxypeptidase-like 48 [Phtheirospermum japonicum]